MEDLATKQCTHRWVLGQPGLGGINGICRRCGASRLYPSTLDLYEHTPDYDEHDRKQIVRSLEATAIGERVPA